MSVVDFSEEEDPHLFLKGSKNLSFEGVRIYKIGGEIVFRVQKEENTHPYGTAYPIQVEEMYDDILSDEMDEEKAGKEVIKSISEEMRKFLIEATKQKKKSGQLSLAITMILWEAFWHLRRAPIMLIKF